MKLTLILLLFLWDNVEFTLTQEDCSQLPTVEHAFVSEEYRKAEYQKGDVIYFSCDPGYTTGLNTTYICTDDGWRDMTSGPCFVLPEGDRSPVRLSCARPPALKNGHVLQKATIYMYLDGKKVIYQCDDLYVLKGGHYKTCSNGQWTGDLQCVATFCEKPLIDNGTVHEDKEKFSQNEVLTFSCDPGYKKVDSEPSVCLQVDSAAPQWSPSPQCEPITCRLSSDPPEETTYNPQNQVIFRPNETVTVSCGEKHWVKSKELQSAELTCQDTGDWDFQPVCKLVTCSKLVENVHEWTHSRSNTGNIVETLEYQCYPEYEKTSPRATCTRRGWQPNPLCKERRCSKPSYRNVEITDDYQKDKYEHKERVNFRCTDDPTVTFGVACFYGEWRGYIPTCEAITCKLRSDPPEGTTYSPRNQIIFRVGEKVTMQCEEKHWVRRTENTSDELTCLDTGDWDIEPVCKPVTCLKHAEYVYAWERTWYNPVSEDTTLWYRCYDGYMETSPTATCTRRGWTPYPLCKSTGCIKPQRKNAEITDNQKNEYNHNEEVSFRCTYDPTVTFDVQCHLGRWRGSYQNCKEKPCTTQPLVENGVWLDSLKAEYDHGERLRFRCNSETRDFRVTCDRGEWKKEKLCADAFLLQ